MQISRTDRIEILSTDLLEIQESLAESFHRYSVDLGLGLGWHYLLDLAWAASHIQAEPGIVVIDAGAGFGLMQWWLCDQGVKVISVDRNERTQLPISVRKKYKVEGLLSDDLANTFNLTRLQIRDFLPPRSPKRWREYGARLKVTARLASKEMHHNDPIALSGGKVIFYDRELSNMTAIPDNSIDVVVAISSLEHNQPEGLRNCLGELLRVLKPGGQIIATLGAAKETDWFHEPSKGWCYTEKSLRDIFDLSVDCFSNYDEYDELFEKLKSCSELKDHLANFYFKSGDNGMPWGIWDPKYMPVGVIKFKSVEG